MDAMFQWKRFMRGAQASYRSGSSPIRPLDPSWNERIGMMIVTHDSTGRDSLQAIASRHNWEATSVQSCDEAVPILNQGAMPLVIYDQDLPDGNWRDSLRRIATVPQPICLLLACRSIDPHLLREAVRCHGYDVISKPFRTEEVVRYVSLAWTSHGLKSSYRGQSNVGRTITYRWFQRART